MIKIEIRVKGTEVHDHLNRNKINREEVALAMLRLEQMKQELSSIRFKSKSETKYNKNNGRT